MKLFPRFLCGALLAFPVLAWSQTVYQIGDFESDLDGWTVPTSGDHIVSATQSSTGATSGSYAVQLQGNIPGGYQAGIERSLIDLGAGLDDLGSASQVLLSFDLTLVGSEWVTAGYDWAQIAGITYSFPDHYNTSELTTATAAGLITDSMNPSYPAGQNMSAVSGTYTTSIEWDITDIMQGTSSSDGWASLLFVVNYSSDFTAGGTYYLDNIALTTSAVPEPSTYALCLGLAALAYVTHRRRRKAARME